MSSMIFFMAAAALAIVLAQRKASSEVTFRQGTRPMPPPPPVDKKPVALLALAPGANKLAVIKVLREVTDLGLAEAKAAVDGIPGSVIQVASRDLQQLRVQLQQVGVTCSLDAHPVPFAARPMGGLVDLELTSVPDGVNKIHLIKLVRELTPLGLKEAKDVVEEAPRLLLSGVGMEEAERARARLTALGVTGTIKPMA